MGGADALVLSLIVDGVGGTGETLSLVGIPVGGSDACNTSVLGINKRCGRWADTREGVLIKEIGLGAASELGL